MREERNQGPVQPVSLLRGKRDVDKRKGCHGGLGEATTCCGMLMNQDLFGEGNNGSRSRPDQRVEQREPARQFVQDPRGEAFASVASNRPRCAARLKHLRLKWKWTIANLDVILYPSVVVGAVKTVLSQSVQQQHACWHLSSRYY